MAYDWNMVSAIATTVAAITGTGAFVVGAISAWGAYRTAKETIKMVESERPYIIITPLGLNPVLGTSIRIQVENLGRSPAIIHTIQLYGLITSTDHLPSPSPNAMVWEIDEALRAGEKRDFTGDSTAITTFFGLAEGVKFVLHYEGVNGRSYNSTSEYRAGRWHRLT